MTHEVVPDEPKPATVPPETPDLDDTKVQSPDAGEIEWAGNLVKRPPGAGTPDQPTQE